MDRKVLQSIAVLEMQAHERKNRNIGCCFMIRMNEGMKKKTKN